MISKSFNIDCMIAMKEFDDKFFDLAVVDPPYGAMCDIASTGKRTTREHGYSDFYINRTADQWNIKPNKEYFEELFRISKNQIIFGGNFFELPPSSCWLVWDKLQDNFSFGDGELAWTSFKKAVRIYKRARFVEKNRIHMTQKPVELYDWIFSKFAKEGMKIIDTHLGSGTSRISAHKNNLDFWGYEINTKFYLLQEEKFKLHLSQLPLPFTPQEKSLMNFDPQNSIF